MTSNSFRFHPFAEECLTDIVLYLLPDAGKDDKEGQEESGKDNVEGDGGGVANDGGPVAVSVQSRTSILTKQIKPASRHVAIQSRLLPAGESIFSVIRPSDVRQCLMC